MAHRNPSDQDLKQILSSASTIAVVGASSNPDRSSNGIMGRLLQLGYRVIPVNPNETDVLGQKAYPSLSTVPVPIDIVDVFRRSPDVAAHVDDILAKRPRAVWLQLGIVDDKSAETWAAAGILVVQDRCLMVDHRRYAR